jgi:predicted DNA binding CopG/RHH family protein
MMAGTKSKLPSFRSDREERDFWARHSVEEFADELEEIDVQVRPARTEQIALRLYKDDIEALKKLAKRRGVGHTTLARSIVEQWIARSRDRPARSANQPRHAN